MDDVLSRLRTAGERGVSGSVLAAALKISRAAVHKKIQKLRALGHGISGVNRVGYRLESLADGFSGEAFREGWGRPFFFFDQTGSTQEEAKRRAASGAPQGALFLAERQTAGRGRRGRLWESPPGGLWYSLVLRPALLPSAVPGLTLVAALDWARLLKEDHGLEARVKWPNDVWIGRQKLAGLLADMSSETDRVHWVVLGAGVNVNNDPPSKALVPAVSLRDVSGRAWRRQDLLSAWMDRFALSFAAYGSGGFSAFRATFERYSLLKGRSIRYESGAGVSRGRVSGVDDEGRLAVRTPRGRILLSAGDVHLSPES